ncbi:MAG: hypothetical protein KAU46_04170 [Candidatus Aminicenantes bacterium]|nr:hypothetical protein [Candidatus Aminicenantes bacterium]
MKRLWIPVFFATVFLAQALQGVVPQKWEIRTKDDFLKGKFNGISVSYGGVLSLSPKQEGINGPAEEFYLSLLVTRENVVYLGTGHSGKIFRMSKNAEPELYFQVPEMDIYCLAQDRRGNLYAGTSPNGKIYKITGKNDGKVLFNPREKYIWDMMFIKGDVLLAAVGENGGIYEITPQGEGRLILKVEENHILCLTRDSNGDLIAGSGGKGLLYRIPEKKKASVLFESPFEEIRDIALDDKGNIFVAASGAVIRPRVEDTPVSVRRQSEVIVTGAPSSLGPEDALTSVKNQPGALYRINREGMAKRLWHSSDELIYSLLWNEKEKTLVFGTGNKGRMYTVDGDGKVSLLAQKSSEQIYYFLPFDSKIYILSNNPSGLSVLYPEQMLNGEYLSRVMDAKTISSWGRIEWEAEVLQGSTIQFQTRSGNSADPNRAWSDWSPPYRKGEGEQILSPKARYIQFRAMLKNQFGKTSPLLREVTLFYLQKNVPPAITTLTLLPANVVYLKPPGQQEVIWGMDVDFSEKIKGDKTMALIVPKKVERKGFQTITWDATDKNGDDMLFSIYIKKDNERRWRVLKEGWEDTIYAFDTLSFPDGNYSVRVMVSDTASNPQGMELRSERVSRSLVIDHSLPVVKNFKAVRNKNKLAVTFQVKDSLSYIKEVKYLIRPDEWRSIFPEDGICDSKQESFKVTVTLPPKSGNLITVKIKDSRGNIGVHRQIF